MDESVGGRNENVKQAERLLFGSFNEEDYEKYFSCDQGVYPCAVEFLFERQSNVSDWINDGTWFVRDVNDHKAIVAELREACHVPVYDNERQHETLAEQDSDTKEMVSQSLSTSPLQSTHITPRLWGDSDADESNGEEPAKDADVESTPAAAAVPVPKEAPKPTVKYSSWASLFKAPGSEKAASVPAPLPNGIEHSQVGATGYEDKDAKRGVDEVVDKVEAMLNGQQLDSSPHVSFQLRGLVNSSNWCFINATLQSLMCSPQFYPAYVTLPRSITTKAGHLTKCLIEFIERFRQLQIDQLPAKPQSVTVSTGLPFEPKSVYDSLPSSKSSLSEKGRQQDAEEFLSFFLNGLHDELVSLKSELCPRSKGDDASNDEASDSSSAVHENGKVDDDEWHHVGPRNKPALTRKTLHETSLITSIFGGSLRSSVRHSGAKESATLQPFFTLPLDIQSDGVNTVTDALRTFFAKECLQGYTCSKTNSEVEASRKLSLEALPSVLILHLKYFLYDQSGGCQKIHKPITISLDLSITKDMMSSTAKPSAPAYTLFAVVYHHGKSAADGHYTAAVRDRSTKPPHLWVHCDDSTVEPCSLNDVVRHEHAKTPYLLFYERNSLV